MSCHCISIDRPSSGPRYRLPLAWLALVLVALPAVCLAAPAGYQAYSLRHAQATEIEPVLRKLLPDVGEANHVLVDSAGNQILLRGTDEGHRIARQLIDKLDQPTAAPAGQAAVLKTYRHDDPDLAGAARRLQAALADSGARVTADQRTAQLIVVAPPEAQARVPQLLAESSLAPPLDSPIQPASPETRWVEPSLRFVQLSHTRTEQLQSMLQKMFRQRITARSQTSDDLPGFAIRMAGGEPVELGFNAPHNQVAVRGPADAVDHVIRLLEVLDSPPQSGGRIVRVMPLGNAEWSKVRKATEAFRGQESSGSDGKSSTESPDASGAQAQPGKLGVQHASGVQDTANTGVEFANLFLQPPTAPPPPGADSALDTPEDQAARERLNQLGTDVQVETLPDLDVIILSGNERDVNELVRIIQEIERISAETEPNVEVVPLEHAPSDAVATLIEGLSEPLLAGRQGRATATALVKPNAMLVVGWGAAFTAMKDLVAKLDQPVDAGTQLRVFRLRHAAAGTVQQTIEEFFQNREGLGPRVIVSADQASNSLIVQASPRDLAEVELLLERIDTGGSDSVSQLRVFRLQNTLAADLGPVLQDAFSATTPGTPAAAQKSSVLQFLTVDAEGRRLLESGALADVRVTPDPRTNTLLVSAPENSMELIAAVIEQLDQLPATVAQIKVFKIVNGDATALVEMLRNLLGVQAAVMIAPRLGAIEGEPALAPIRFSVDTRTNTIVASGPAGELNIVEAILLRLDESDDKQRQSTVYRLKNSPAIDVATSVNEFLRSERLVQQAAPGLASPFEQIEREVVVVPEPVSNSLIVSATPRYYDEIVEIIEELDAQPPQVLIQVLIAEVRLNNTDEFGVELGIQDSLLFDRSLVGSIVDDGQAIPRGVHEPGFLFNNQQLGNSASDRSLATAGNVAGQALSSFALSRTNSDLGYGGLVLSASSESISVLLRALRETRRLDVLSRPQVMTLDNQPAFIQVGQRVPRIAGSTINQVGQVNDIVLENVGLILAVTPRVSPDGMVIMEVDAEKSAVSNQPGIPVAVNTQTGEPVTSPIFDTTTAQTTVSSASGQTIILGGLITRSESMIKRRIPYLSDVPLLGHLFRYDSNVSERTELLIILTPHVVRSQEEASRLKQIEASRMNWCLGDVQQLHGDCRICQRGDCEHCEAATQVIYPDLDPTGTIELETIPTPTGLPEPTESISPPFFDTPELMPQPSAQGATESPPAAIAPASAATPPAGHVPTVPTVEPAALRATSRTSRAAGAGAGFSE